MNPLTRNILTSIIGAALVVAPMITLSSCDAVYEDLEECPEGARLRFVYEYNMEFANAFPSQVDCLTLLVYDEDGNYRETRIETSAILADENYRMTIDLPAGKYTFVAYGGMECAESSFHFLNGPSPSRPLSELEVQMNTDCITQPVGTKLHNLFYGLLEMEVADSTNYTEGTVRLMKDTNNIRILLQQLNGKPVSDRDFNFVIADDNNTLFDWRNIPVPGTAPITYYPWITGQATAGEETDGQDAVLA